MSSEGKEGVMVNWCMYMPLLSFSQVLHRSESLTFLLAYRWKIFLKIQVYIRRISNTFALRIYFLEQIFEGNNPSTKTVKHELLREVIPLYIRLNVKDSTATYAGLKLELYGCKRKYIIFPVICSAVALSSRIRSTRQQIYWLFHTWTIPKTDGDRGDF